MTLEEYMRELVLMSRQYGQEEELYPLINMLLRENDNVRHLSVRDVHDHNGKGMRKALLYGFASFPDLVILDERYNVELKEIQENNIQEQVNTALDQKKWMYGCVEAKGLTKETLINKIESSKWGYNGYKEEEKSIIKTKFKTIYRDIHTKNKIQENFGQVFGELLWYGKVLYTNGLDWYYLEFQNKEEIIEDAINGKKKIDRVDKKNIDIVINLINSIIEKKNTIKEELKKQSYEQNKETENELRKLTYELNKETEKIFQSCLDSYDKKDIDINISYIIIGSLEKTYNNIQKKIQEEKEQRISVSAVGQYINDEDRQEWNRLKDNLACINWYGTNTLNQFQLKPEI